MPYPKVLIIDHYDSFTYNLVQLFGIQGASVEVLFHDEVSLKIVEAQAPTHLCLSPGPGTPQNAPRSLEIIHAFSNTLPILGVCLGFQCLVRYFGGEIVRAADPMHGKISSIIHTETSLFSGIPHL